MFDILFMRWASSRRRHVVNDIIASDMVALGTSILEASTAIARIVDAAVDVQGVTITKSQMAVLRHLADRGPSAMLDLAAAIGVTGPTMTSTVRILLRKDLIERRHDLHDWRTVLVSISDAGRTAVDSVLAARRRAVARAITDLPADQRALLTVALPALRGLAASIGGTISHRIP